MKTPSFIPTSLNSRVSFFLALPLILGPVLLTTQKAVPMPFSFHKPAAGLQLTSVVSRKTHAGSGTFDTDLPLSGPPGIECRSGGVNLNHTLVFTFNHNMDPNANTTAAVTPAGSGNVGGAPVINGHTITINLTGVGNAQIITITMHNATDEFGQVLPDTSVNMGVLLGDVTGDGLVNDDDVALTVARVGQVPDATTFGSDVNANGTINAADVAIIRSRLGGPSLHCDTISPDPATHLSFSGPTSINLATTTTFTVSVFVTFSGYSAYGVSYWMETGNDLAPFIQTGTATYSTFGAPNQTAPNPALFSATNGATSGFMTEGRDLGATSSTAIAPGTYHITDITFCLDPNTPNGTYALQWTTVCPRFSSVTDDSFHAHRMAPATAFTFMVTGVGPQPPPPPCGIISGTITNAQGPVQGAIVQACQVNPPATPPCQADNGQCASATTNASGAYQITGLPVNTPINLTVNPPAGSFDFPGALFNRIVSDCGTPLTNQDIMLQGPHVPPPGTSINPHNTAGDGLPSVYPSQTLTLTTMGCANGTASYTITSGPSTYSSGTMTETPAGSGIYQASVLPLNPARGAATVTMTIHCPDNTTQTISFDMYIDPSGIVRDSHGTLLAGATVTLLRSDSAAGPFTVVPDGSAVMSPGNRTNPDMTDAQGHFGWDVLEGFYKVRAQKSGCNGIVETGALQIPPPVTDLVLTLNCPTQLTTTVSLKTHGTAGNFTINLPLSGQPGIECRTGGANGNHTLVFTFSNNITSGSASVTSGTGSVAGNPTFNANTMTVNLTGVTNQQTLTVTLSNVTDSFGQVLPDIPLSVSFLLGDSNGNRAVNATDVALTKSRLGQPINQTNARSDVNADGAMNASDVSLIKLKIGTGLP